MEGLAWLRVLIPKCGILICDSTEKMCIIRMNLVQISPFSYALLAHQRFKVQRSMLILKRLVAAEKCTSCQAESMLHANPRTWGGLLHEGHYYKVASRLNKVLLRVRPSFRC